MQTAQTNKNAAKDKEIQGIITKYKTNHKKELEQKIMDKNTKKDDKVKNSTVSAVVKPAEKVAVVAVKPVVAFVATVEVPVTMADQIDEVYNELHQNDDKE